jgi:N-acetylmuramoyl-L-alanine amidase
MKTSSHPALQKPSLIILSAGHGGGEPGACFQGHQEAQQAIFMVDVMADVLRSLGVASVKVPHTLGLQAGIAWINERYALGSAWALEIHRDSAVKSEFFDASTRCGIYYGTSAASRAISETLRLSMLRHGAGNRTWSRPDTVSNHKRLAWIRGPKPMSHLLELGFMQGANDDAHLRWLATMAAKAVCEVFTGQSLPVG